MSENRADAYEADLERAILHIESSIGPWAGTARSCPSLRKLLTFTAQCQRERANCASTTRSCAPTNRVGYMDGGMVKVDGSGWGTSTRCTTSGSAGGRMAGRAENEAPLVGRVGQREGPKDCRRADG